MHAFAGEGVEVGRERGYEGFTFTGGHFGDLTLVQHDTADQLYVVMHHVPGHFDTAGNPGILPGHFVTFNGNIVAENGQVAVHFSCGSGDGGIFFQPAGGFLYNGKGFGQELGEYLFDFLVAVFAQLVDLAVGEIFGIYVFFRFSGSFLFSDLPVYFGQVFLNAGTENLRFTTQFVDRQG